MKYIFLIALCIFLVRCTGSVPSSKVQAEIEKGSTEEVTPVTGLKLHYKPTRGQSFTDQRGRRFGLRHIPVMITNDSSVAIQIDITFSEKYEFPKTYNDETFHLFPLSKEWGLDGVEITDSMLMEIPGFIDEPGMSKILVPGEEWTLALASIYPLPINYSVFPVAVQSYDYRNIDHECHQLIEPGKLEISTSELNIVIGFTSGSQASPESCSVIPIGRISYPSQ